MITSVREDKGRTEGGQTQVRSGQVRSGPQPERLERPAVLIISNETRSD